MKPLSRRRFLAQSSSLTMGLTAGIQVAWPQTTARGASASDQVVLGLIGAGGRGSQLAANFVQIKGVQFKYVCDPFLSRAEGESKVLATKQEQKPIAVQDLRRVFEDKDVTAVVIATPEHWHALATVWACQAGKDVYVEKNTSLRLQEGAKMIQAASKHQRIVQVGFQNRSGPYAQSAREYLKSGQLGKVVLVKVYNLLEAGPWKPQPDGPPPAGLDWDLWLGPAPEVPYNASRQNGWNDWWDYCGGAFSGDASHQLDLARMALGDPPPPRSVSCVGGRLAFADQRQIPDLMEVTYDYGDFIMTCESGTATPYMKKFQTEVRYGKQWPYWPQSATRIEIYGTNQLMYLGRHGCGWQVMETGGTVVAQDKGYFPDKWHQPNFIDCVRSRQNPNASLETSQASALLIHLGVASYRAGKKQLQFDAGSSRITNDDAANEWLKPFARKDFRLPDSV
jgi:predicted dehydrogenase